MALPQKKSEPLWIWKAWDRATGQLVDWECGGRDKATCERLIERLKRWRTRLYCADDYAVYGVLLPVGQLYTGKEETHGIARILRVVGLPSLMALTSPKSDLQDVHAAPVLVSAGPKAA